MYGGTKSEMERLLRKAEELEGLQIGSYSIENFSDIVSAIHAIQTEMGITGTTEDEAAKTIEGSIAATKAAWTNLLTELGKDDADIGTRIDELMTSIFGDGTEDNPGAFGNIAPRVLTIIQHVMEAIPQAIETAKPYIDQAMQMISTFVEEHGPELQAAAEVMFGALTQAMGVVFSAAMQALGQAIGHLIMTFPEWFPKLLMAAIDFLGAIIEGINQAGVPILRAMGDLLWGAIDVVKNAVSEFFNAGANLIQGLIDGIVSGASNVINAIGNTISNAINAAKSMLGIHSPSKVFAEIGGNTMLGLAEGIDGAAGKAESAMKAAIDNLSMSPSLSVTGNGAYNGAGDSSGLVINVYVDGRAAEDYNALGRHIGDAAGLRLMELGYA
jgi:phage-related protein